MRFRTVYKYKLFFLVILINILSIGLTYDFSYGNTCAYFNEDFSGLSSNIWTSGSGTWIVQNGKVNVSQITSGKYAHYTTSFSPSDYFVLDTDVEGVSLSSDGAYGIAPYTTGDVYLSVDGKVLDGIGAIIFQSGNAYLFGYDITSHTWYNSSTHIVTTSPVTSIGVAYSSNAVTLRINKQDTTLKFSGNFSFAPQVINKLELYAQGTGSTVTFDNTCASPLSTPQPSSLQSPQNLRYTLNGNMLTINWGAVTGATGYKIGLGVMPGSYLGDYDVGNITQIGPFDVSGGSGTFYLAAKAYNGSGESAYSNEITVTFGAASMQIPQNLRYVYDSNNMLTISWDATSGASGYKLGIGIQAGSYVGFYDIGKITQIGPLDPNILTAGTYFFVMRAYNSSLESGDSNEIALKVGSSVTEPVDLPGLASSFMGGLGHYNPTTSPAIIATIKATFHAGGITALENLATTTYPQFVHSIPNGLLLDFGNGYTTKFGNVLTGSIALTHSNIVTAGSRTTGNFSVIANNVHQNGKFLADGSASGAVDITFDANDKVIGDLTFSGILNSAGLSGAAIGSSLIDGNTISNAVISGAISGNIHVDGTKCPNYPVSGSVSVTIGGETKTMTFNNKCDGSYSTSHIDSITPNSGKPGDTVTITGSGFGTTQGSSTVKFVGTTATVVSWSATSIVVTVPNITSTGDVIVNVGGADSNGVTFTVVNQCSTQQVAGKDTPETRVIDLGINHGTFRFDYDTQVQKDRITVTYEGTALFDTGCVGTAGTKTQNITYSGSATSVTVTVQPNCAGGTGTAWSFKVYCPQ